MRASRFALVAALAGLGIGAAAGTACAQADGARGPREYFLRPTDRGAWGVEVSAGLAASLAEGVAVRRADRGYRDLFGEGSGPDVALRFPLTVLRRGSLDLGVGPVARFQQTTYRGRRDTGSDGDVLEPRDMTVRHFLVGAHFRARFRDFFLAPEFAVGFASVHEVDAVYDPRGSGTPAFEATLYDQTYTYAFSFTLRAGVLHDVGGGAFLAAFGFAGYSVTGAPEGAGGAEAPALAADPDPILSGYVGIGVSIHFGGLGARPAGTRSRSGGCSSSRP